MKYQKTIRLKDGRECCLRNGSEPDGARVLEHFNLTHAETDYLLAYPDENSFDAAQESQYLQEMEKSKNGVYLLALVDGVLAGTAVIEPVGTKYKVRHWAELGLSVLKEFWGLGIGQALMTSCIECARAAGYDQLELSVVSKNVRAISLYKKAGFTEYGRNPKGFRSRTAGFQELVDMCLDLRDR